MPMVRWVEVTWAFCSLRGVRAAEGPRPQAPRPGWPRSSRARTSATLVLAVLAEVVAPIFIAAGLWTRWAAIPVAATMAVAAFMVHSGDPLDNREPALLFLIGFGTIMCTGAGHFSIDSLRVKRGA